MSCSKYMRWIILTISLLNMSMNSYANQDSNFLDIKDPTQPIELIQKQLGIQGIFSNQGAKYCIINDKTLKVGGVIENHQIIDIQDNIVVLLTETGNKVILELSE